MDSDKLKTLEKLIVGWAKRRNLFEEGRLTKQLLKFSEECLELQNAIESYANTASKNKTKIYDGIGDMYVTLIIALEMKEICYEKIKRNPTSVIVDTEYFTLIKRLKRIDGSMWNIFNKLIGNKYEFLRIVNDCIYLLNTIAIRYGATLEECVELAYNEIKDRKGQVIDGTFVKEK